MQFWIHRILPTYLATCCLLINVSHSKKENSCWTDSQTLTFSQLKKCKGKPYKVVQSIEKRFQFIYYERPVEPTWLLKPEFVEYVYDNKENQFCSKGPVKYMKTNKDKSNCYPCGDSDC